MVRLQRKRFTEPTEVRGFTHGHVDIVELDDIVVGRLVHEPGWRWSVDVKPVAGTDLCEYHHVAFAVQGELRAQLPDGAELAIKAGDVFEIPPGHDAWTVGDETFIAIDFGGARAYARPREQSVERYLATLLFSDIVDSTGLAARLGPAAWRELIGAHNERAQAVVDRFGGRLVKSTGDGILATFDGAERAVRAAALLRSRLRDIGLEIRQGVHSGEVEMLGGDPRGIAVHVAARIMGLAGPGEILISATVHDLLDGAGFAFDDRGRHALKGVDGERQVYAVQETAPRPAAGLQHA